MCSEAGRSAREDRATYIIDSVLPLAARLE